jgi:hypothetical protein
MERCRCILHASCRTDAKVFSDKASKIASSDSLRIEAGLSEGCGLFGLEKLGLRKWSVTVLWDFASPLGVATRSLSISTAFNPFRLRHITIDCWSIETTDLNESVLTSGEVKIRLNRKRYPKDDQKRTKN